MPVSDKYLLQYLDFDLRLILWFLLLDPQVWPEGSYEIRSDLPSIHRRMKFSVVLGLLNVTVRFFWKKDNVRNGLKEPENKVFWIFFKKI